MSEKTLSPIPTGVVQKNLSSTSERVELPMTCGFNSWAFSGVERGWALTVVKTLKVVLSKIFWARDCAALRSNPSQRPGKRRILFSPLELEKCFLSEVRK